MPPLQSWEIFPQKLLHYQHTFFTFARDALHLSHKALHRTIGALHACCISSYYHSQNSIFGVLPSGGQTYGRWRVLNWDCRENEGEQIQGADFCSKVMARIFWDSEGILLVEFRNRGATINSEWYMQILKMLKQQIQLIYLPVWQNQVLLLQDNARPQHKGPITTVGWVVLPHPPYNPDWAPSNFRLFGPLKDELQGHCFVDGKDKPKHNMREVKSSDTSAMSTSDWHTASHAKVEKMHW